MSRFRGRLGWLLYSGDLGTIAADVVDADMSVQTSTLDVTSWASPVRQLLRGPTEITFTASLYEKKMQWDRDPTGGETPHLAALLALARNHPDEYNELRERETILKALGG
jgi:hypothetical protein